VPVADLLTSLRDRYPAKRVLVEPSRLAPYESDALTAFSARPEAVVLADGRDEVIDLVRRCHREGVPFVARGSGTSLSGGSLPVEGGIVIGLNRFNRILRVDPADGIAVVEPGVINDQVSAAAAPHGLFYAPDPSSQSVCTIGGNLAFNSGGAHCLKHGMTSNHVLAIEAVLPDGEVVRLGSGSAEPAGPDWLGLFVGSEGLFGIALEVTLRLLPLPEEARTILAAYPSLEAAGDAVAATIAAGILPVAMEIMDSLAIRAAESSVKPGYPDVPALLIVELDGERDAVETDFERLSAVIRDSGATEVRTTADPAERAMIWKGRKSAFSAVGWLSPDYIVQDGCVPRTRLGEALATIERLSGEHGLRVANVFHAGDGNLHPLILFDGREPGAVDRAHALAGEILDLCIELGGSITGEHGVGVEKRAFLERMFGPSDLELMRRLRAAIDPAELANRGKMLPAANREETQFAAPGSGNRPVPAARVLGDGDGAGDRGAAGLAGDPRVATLREALLAARRDGERVLPRGGGTKPALSTPAGGASSLEVGGLRGIARYDPEELTLTALAGTPVAELSEALAANGQHLPFDPPLAAAGATLGGVVAAGTSGPGRHRHGGVRDFVVGARFLDGTGELIAGGGRVVKNAAGFDLPKLLVGSLGRLGVIVEVSLKVLPAPRAWGTVRADPGELETALEAIARLGAAGLDLEALDLEPPGRVWVRIGGPPEGLERRLARVEDALGPPAERLLGADEAEPWSSARELVWTPPGTHLAKLATTPGRVRELEAALAPAGAARRYSAGCHLCWVAWPAGRPPSALDAIAREQAVSGVWLTGSPGSPLLGASYAGAFAARARHGLDPAGVLAPYEGSG
jgi:glycolate oxidase